MQAKVKYALGSCLLVLAAVGGSAWLEAPQCLGQQAAAGAGPDIGGMYPGGYKSVKACRLCHRGQIRELDPEPDKSFVLLNEPAIWLTDPHSQAFALIDWSTSAAPQTAGQRLSRDICVKLGIADIHQARQCLSCHANWVAGLEQPPPLYAAGVGCESCHGPSAGWENEHKEITWRARPVAYKTEKGMIDVRNPIKRAEQCFSCHIGNVEQGKLITHEMYAAGHPPLPSIEIESFARQMPRHWRYLEEKIADSRKLAGPGNADAPPFKFFAEFVRENHTYLQARDGAETLKLAADHHHGAAAVVLGGAVALREAIELTGDLASSTAPTPWPELASLDCTACHHDLKQPAPGQTGAGQWRASRPVWHAWPTALIQLAIFHISVDDAGRQRKLAEFNAKLAAVQDNFATTPFGDPGPLRQAATDLARWLTDELITPVAEKPFDTSAVRLACRRLVYLVGAEQRDFDYDSARQIAWALRTLYCDLDEKPPGDAQIHVLFRQLAGDLRLDLPNSSGEFCATEAKDAAPGAAPRANVIPLADSLPAALAVEVRFDSDRFKETINKLQALLK